MLNTGAIQLNRIVLGLFGHLKIYIPKILFGDALQLFSICQ
jgi:hypothetical protein